MHTGAGKGKSTAAFGMALRAWNQGFDVAVFQFVKSAKWKVGEEAAFRELGRLHDEHGVGGPVEWHKMGAGWSWSRKAGTDVDHAAAAADGWAEIARRLAEQRHDFYVLDEFTYPLKWGWVDVDEVIATLTARPGTQHVVITGRDAPQPLLDAADLVTEMTKVKHPMDAGRKGPEGHRVVSHSASWGTSACKERAAADSPSIDSHARRAPPVRGDASKRAREDARWREYPGRGDRRAGVGQRKDHGGNGLMGATAGRPPRRAVQGGPGLHRPRLSRAGGGPARPQPRPGAGRRRTDRPAVPARQRGLPTSP